MSVQNDKSQVKRIPIGWLVIVFVIIFIAVWESRFWRWNFFDGGDSEEASAQVSKVIGGKKVMQSALAGMWYSADAEVLEKDINGFFADADVKPNRDVIGLILPHAGYRYSGKTAAGGVNCADGEYKRVIVIGPSHRIGMEDMLSVPRFTHYGTPLGEVALDVEFIGRLLKYANFQSVPRAHEHEHSVQIELPLLQCRFADFKFVPIVAGQCSLEVIEEVAKILRSMVDSETLVIASSDFVHYGPNYSYMPFQDDVPQQIKKLDMGAYECISRLDYKGFLGYKKETGATICGAIPIAILLAMFDEGVKAELVGYTTSGEMMGDYSNSVSYLCAAFSGKWNSHPAIEAKEQSYELSESEKWGLLSLARSSMSGFLKNRSIVNPEELGIEITDAMKRPRAAFVTLKREEGLRGCIGEIFPSQPLYKSVIVNSINAAVNDRRFLPVTIGECNDISIEISALTVPEPVANADEIRIGVDGIVLRKDGRSAVYLPQVAPEQGWDLAETLTHLSEKAGLDGDAWREEASFLVFQAEVFGEKEK